MSTRANRAPEHGLLQAVRDDVNGLLAKVSEEAKARREFARRIERRVFVLEQGVDSRLRAIERELRIFPEPAARAVPILDGDDY